MAATIAAADILAARQHGSTAARQHGSTAGGDLAPVDAAGERQPL